MDEVKFIDHANLTINLLPTWVALFGPNKSKDHVNLHIQGHKQHLSGRRYVVNEDDVKEFFNWKLMLSSHFHMKDFRLSRYFLGIKVARSKKDSKYLAGLLKETSMLRSKCMDAPINPNIYFDQNLWGPLVKFDEYIRLTREMIYFTDSTSSYFCCGCWADTCIVHNNFIRLLLVVSYDI